MTERQTTEQQTTERQTDSPDRRDGRRSSAAERPLTARATYRSLVVSGFTPGEAANVVAYLHGLAIAREPWAIDEVTKLLFLRELDRLGVFAPDGND